MEKNFYEILKQHEERIRGLYSTYYSNYILADGKTERKYKNECKNKCDEFIAQIRMIEILKSDYKQLNKSK